jgi:hypothetical protein
MYRKFDVTRIFCLHSTFFWGSKHSLCLSFPFFLKKKLFFRPLLLNDIRVKSGPWKKKDNTFSLGKVKTEWQYIRRYHGGRRNGYISCHAMVEAEKSSSGLEWRETVGRGQRRNAYRTIVRTDWCEVVELLLVKVCRYMACGSCGPIFPLLKLVRMHARRNNIPGFLYASYRQEEEKEFRNLWANENI